MQDGDLTEEVFAKFRELIYKVAGIKIPETKKVMVANRLRRRLRATGIAGFTEYYRVPDLRRRRRPRCRSFLNEITTNETYFYRDIQHFDWLQRGVLPADRRGRPALEAAQDACGSGRRRRARARSFTRSPCGSCRSATCSRLEDHAPGDRPLGRRARGRRRGQLRRAGRPPRRPGRADPLLRPRPQGAALDREGRAPVAGDLEVAQPAPADRRGAVRLRLHQECPDLFRRPVEAGGDPAPDRLRWPRAAISWSAPRRGSTTCSIRSRSVSPGSTSVRRTDSTFAEGHVPMAGFDLSELLPYYLDETDEQIGVLNDALLKLERDPADAAVLREAFRMVHSIKGSSTVMGFDQVKRLTHHLETFFDQLRSRPADARPAHARPQLPLPRRPPRLPPPAPERQSGCRRPLGADPARCSPRSKPSSGDSARRIVSEHGGPDRSFGRGRSGMRCGSRSTSSRGSPGPT